jgi:hypothetical protein
MDVEIDEVVTEMVVMDGSPSLSREDLKKIIEAVKQHFKSEKETDQQRDNDTSIRDRAYKQEGQ